MEVGVIRGMMIALLRGILFFSVSFSAVIVIEPIALLLGRIKYLRNMPLWVVIWFVRLVYPLFGIKLEVRGIENTLASKPYLVLCNHQSFLDIPIVLSCVRLVAFISKIEIKKWPLFGYGMKQMDCIFVDRNCEESRKQVGPAMVEKMNQGTSYCVFPEGTRSGDGKLLPFRAGIFRIAQSCNLEILPVTIVDACKVLRKKSLKLFSGTIHCVIHKPVLPHAFSTHIELMDHIRSIIKEPLDSQVS